MLEPENNLQDFVTPFVARFLGQEASAKRTCNFFVTYSHSFFMMTNDDVQAANNTKKVEEN